MVEPAVVRDDNRRIVDESVHRRLVDPMARDHLVGDACKCRYLVGDRHARLVEGGERVPDASDTAARQVIELYHPELDHFVLAGVEACRLGVEQDSRARFLIWRRDVRQPRDQAPKDPVVRRQIQSVGHRGEVDRVLKHRFPNGSCGQADRSGNPYNIPCSWRQVSKRQAICGLFVDNRPDRVALRDNAAIRVFAGCRS
jgi:hypothetical protein